jgi:hypothetical protein
MKEIIYVTKCDEKDCDNDFKSIHRNEEGNFIQFTGYEEKEMRDGKEHKIDYIDEKHFCSEKCINIWKMKNPKKNLFISCLRL